MKGNMIWSRFLQGSDRLDWFPLYRPGIRGSTIVLFLWKCWNLARNVEVGNNERANGSRSRIHIWATRYWDFLFICESWKIKCITVSTKILCSTTVFNIDNNQKCFLSSKSAYYYDFWRSCDSEDWSNDAENTAAHHRNKLHFNRYSHRKQPF